jgi:uncharacterized protein
MKDALAVFIKAPVPGLCKTRLSPPLSAEQAAALYRAFCADVLAAAAKTRAEAWIAYQPHETFPTPAWAGPQPYFLQRGVLLGEKLSGAFETLSAKGYHRVVVIGSDAPSLPAARLQEAFRALEARDAVFGPADDGGYYLVGLRRPRPALFEGISWSTDRVMTETRRALEREGLSAAFLPAHYDADTVADLRRLRREPGLEHACPETAERLRELAGLID